MGILGAASPLLVSSAALGLTVTAIAISVILFASNFTVIGAQQSLASQPGEIENGTTAAVAATVPATTTFQSTNDSFSIQVPDGWVIHDVNNTGSALLEETTRGYGVLAQLCPEEKEEQQQLQQGAVLPNASGGSSINSSSNNSTSNVCQGSEEVIHIIRYPDLETRIQAANNVTSSSNSSNNMTTGNILTYNIQKLQEVGYRGIEIVNSTDMTLNLTNPQTNQTIATVPAKLVEMAYSTNSDSNETRTGYFILTYTNETAPNPGTTKGYSVFYEGSPRTNTAATPEITTATAAAASSSLLAPTPLPPVVDQVLDSFELIGAAEVTQAIAQESQAAETTDGDDDDGANNDDNSASNNDDGANNDDNSASNNDDGETSDGGISSRGDSHAGDDYDGDDDDGANNDDNSASNNDDGETSDGGISSRGDSHAGDDYDGDDDDGANNDDNSASDDYDGDDDDGANNDDGETSDGGISSRGDSHAGDDY
jgi:hypothetical protein